MQVVDCLIGESQTYAIHNRIIYNDLLMHTIMEGREHNSSIDVFVINSDQLKVFHWVNQRYLQTNLKVNLFGLLF